MTLTSFNTLRFPEQEPHEAADHPVVYMDEDWVVLEVLEDEDDMYTEDEDDVDDEDEDDVDDDDEGDVSC